MTYPEDKRAIIAPKLIFAKKKKKKNLSSYEMTIDPSPTKKQGTKHP